MEKRLFLVEGYMQNGRMIDSTIQETIENLRDLKDDWDGDGAVAPSIAIINTALQLSEYLKPPFRVLCTANGTIVFEWNLPEYYQEIEVENVNQIAFRRVPQTIPSLTKRIKVY